MTHAAVGNTILASMHSFNVSSEHQVKFTKKNVKPKESPFFPKIDLIKTKARLFSHLKLVPTDRIKMTAR